MLSTQSALLCDLFISLFILSGFCWFVEIEHLQHSSAVQWTFKRQDLYQTAICHFLTCLPSAGDRRRRRLSSRPSLILSALCLLFCLLPFSPQWC